MANKFWVVCCGCGEVGRADSHSEAWSRVRHEGHGHEAENASWEEAEARGLGEEFFPRHDD